MRRQSRNTALALTVSARSVEGKEGLASRFQTSVVSFEETIGALALWHQLPTDRFGTPNRGRRRLPFEVPRAFPAQDCAGPRRWVSLQSATMEMYYPVTDLAGHARRPTRASLAVFPLLGRAPAASPGRRGRRRGRRRSGAAGAEAAAAASAPGRFFGDAGRVISNAQGR